MEFDYKEFKHEAIMSCAPTMRKNGFDIAIILTILQFAAQFLSTCMNKQDAVSAAKAIKSGSTAANIALTKAVREALKQRGQKSTMVQREDVRDNVADFLKAQSDDTLIAMCKEAKNAPNFSDLAI